MDVHRIRWHRILSKRVPRKWKPFNVVQIFYFIFLWLILICNKQEPEKERGGELTCDKVSVLRMDLYLCGLISPTFAQSWYRYLLTLDSENKLYIYAIKLVRLSDACNLPIPLWRGSDLIITLFKCQWKCVLNYTCHIILPPLSERYRNISSLLAF